MSLQAGSAELWSPATSSPVWQHRTSAVGLAGGHHPGAFPEPELRESSEAVVLDEVGGRGGLSGEPRIKIVCGGLWVTIPVFPQNCGRKFSGTKIAGDRDGLRGGRTRGRLAAWIDLPTSLTSAGCTSSPLSCALRTERARRVPPHTGASPLLGSRRSLLPFGRSPGSQ